MVSKDDTVIEYPIKNGRKVALYPQDQLKIGDNILIHKQYNGEYLTPGRLDVDNILNTTPYGGGGGYNTYGGHNLGGGSNIVIIPKGRGKGGGGGGKGGGGGGAFGGGNFGGGGGGGGGNFGGGGLDDQGCIRMLMISAGSGGAGTGGGYNAYFLPEKPFWAGDLPGGILPYMYIFTDVYGGDDQGCFQDWYPKGNIRIYFSTQFGGMGGWFDSGGNPPSIIQTGDIVCGDQFVYSWPCDQGTYAFGAIRGSATRLITGVWIHIRNNTSFYFDCGSAKQVINLKVCYKPHPEWKDGPI